MGWLRIHIWGERELSRKCRRDFHRLQMESMEANKLRSCKYEGLQSENQLCETKSVENYWIYVQKLRKTR